MKEKLPKGFKIAKLTPKEKEYWDKYLADLKDNPEPCCTGGLRSRKFQKENNGKRDKNG